jgi:hypothetical protein
MSPRDPHARDLTTSFGSSLATSRELAVLVKKTRTSPKSSASFLAGEPRVQCCEVPQRALAAVDDLVRAVLAGERRIVVFDVEATCWKKGVFSR